MINEIDLIEMGKAAKKAALTMAKATTQQKNRALEAIAKGLKDEHDAIMHANDKDIAAAKAAGVSEALLDRLSLKGRLEAIAEDVINVVNLADPIGEVFEERTLPNGLQLSKARVPIGVLGVIYEARPNVTIDIAVLTIKTGNCAILRGGSETVHSNRALMKVIEKALQENQLPSTTIQFIPSQDRAYVRQMLKLHEYIDLIIPRGGAGLHQFCRENSNIPVITGGVGICHLYVDESANLEKALDVIYNAKIQRPAACNALDTVLVHSKVALAFIPKVIEKLHEKKVAFRLDPQALKIVKPSPHIEPAGLQDWDTEWVSLILGIKVVNNIDEAIDHIQLHSMNHSDGILTENHDNAAKFISEVDSCAVYVNASTRFTDGGQFGLGAEVAVSTQKLHARGPMGLRELTSYKWIGRGDYHVRK